MAIHGSNGSPSMGAAASSKNKSRRKKNMPQQQQPEEQQFSFLVETSRVAFTGDYVESVFAYENALQKAHQLTRSYGSIRRVAGDGNCFYRAFLFSWFERLPAEDMASVCERLLSSSQQLCSAAGYDLAVYEDFSEAFAATMQAVQLAGCNREATLLEAFNEPQISNRIVVFFRLIVAAIVKAEKERWEGFINYEEYASFEAYVDMLSTLGRDSDNLTVAILSTYLAANTTVCVVDNVEGGGDSYVFEGEKPGALPIHLLYRPGHYDILYEKNKN